MRARVVGAVLASVVSAWAKGAGAGEPSAAEQLFAEGKSLVLEQRFDEGCPRLEESFRLEPGIGTALWLGDCYEKSGRRVRALASFQRAASLARARNDDRGAVAERRAAILDERLPHLEIVPPATSDITVLRDGVPVDRSELGVAVPLEPGVHVVAATAPGAEKWSTRVELPDVPATIRVEIPVRAAASPPPATTETTATPRAARPEGPASSPRDSGAFPFRYGALAAGAVGLAGVSVGVVYGLGANGAYAASNDGGHCAPNNACDAEGKRLRREAFDQATVSTVAFGAGALALGTSLVLWLVAPPTSDTETKKGATGLLRSVDLSPGGASFRHTW